MVPISAIVRGVTPSPPCRLGIGLLLLLAGLVPSCDDKDHGCEPGVPCPCGGGNACVLDCRDTEHCIPICSSARLCDVRCGEGCAYDCSNISDCRVGTGPDSTVRCASVSTCTATVAARSTVDCSNLSLCRVACTADCEVRCPGVGDCDVACAEQGAATDCGDGRWVCDRPC